jgi:hypothetical protein
VKWHKPLFWAVLLSASLVVWFVRNAPQRDSPGALSVAHAQDKQHIDEHNCEVCHGPDTNDRSGMAKACEKCHEDISRQIAEERGLHGRLPRNPTHCGACHSEHHGPQILMVNKASFLRAGVDGETFDHAGLDYRLGGAHLKLTCVKCHENSEASLLEKGKKRFIGKSQKCASCHTDPHEGRMADCRSCHGEERPFREAPLFKHDRLFPLSGSHAGLDCAKCHEKAGSYSIEADHEAQQQVRLVARACVVCHADPHAGQNGEKSCRECHGDEGWKPTR